MRIDPEELSDNVAWVQQLAAQLVTDGPDADDLAQEALLAWWAAPDGSVQRLRAWLGTVLRNRAKTASTRASRRRRREHAAARSEGVPSTDEVLGRAEMHRELVDAVLALSESSRIIILYRYFEDLPVSTIGEKLGLSTDAVRSRLRRSIDELRRALDRRHGDRESWLAGMVLLVPQPASLPATTSTPATAFWGGLSMSTKVTTVSAVAFAALAVCAALVLFAGNGAVEEARELPPVAERVREPEVPQATPSIATAASQAPQTNEEAAPRAAQSPVGGAIVGRVTDPAGLPLAGLWVHAVPVRAERGGASLPVTLPAARPRSAAGGATTDADGRYSLLERAAGDYSLVVQGPGIRVTRKSGILVADGATETVDVIALPGLEIRGIVRTPDGEPVAGVRVVAEQPLEDAWGTNTRVVLGAAAREALGDPIEAEGETDEVGSFLLTGLGDRAYSVSATLAPWAPARLESVRPVESRSADDPVELQLTAAASLIGVVQGEDGSAVPDAMIVCLSPGGAVATARSDDNGRFELAGVLPGRVEVRAQAEHFVPTVESDVDVTASESTELTLVLQAAVTVSGLVVDGAGEPIRGARVRLRPVSSERELSGARGATPGLTTASDGVFELTQLRPGQEYRGDVRCPGYIATELQPFLVPAEGLDLGEITLGDGATVTGVVLDPAGLPVSGARVGISDGAAESSLGTLVGGRLGNSLSAAGSATAMTDEAGHFELRGIEPGTRKLRVTADGFALHVTEAFELFDSDVHTVNVTLDRGLVIAGSVTDPHGTPIPGATVAFLRPSELTPAYRTTTDAKGHFEQPGLSSEAFTLRVTATGFSALTQHDVAPPQRELRLLLSTGSTVAGTVLRVSNRLPVEDFTVKLFRADGSVVEQLLARDKPISRRVRDSAGSFALEGVSPGPYDLEVHADALVSFRERIVVGDSETTSHLVLLEAGGILTGRVVDAGGNPIEGAEVAVDIDGDNGARLTKTVRQFQEKFGKLEEMQGGDSSESDATKTDADGRFLLRGVPSGNVDVQVTHRDYPAEKLEGVRVISDQTRELAPITLRRGCSLTGRILEADGTPALFATLLVYELEPSGKRKRPILVTLRGRDGRFERNDLKPARYAVTVHGGSTNRRIRVDLSASAPADAVVDLRHGGTEVLELTLE